MSAPSSSGRCESGEANVLSTTTMGGSPRAPCVRVRALGDRGDVDQLEQRIGRRLDPDHPGPVVSAAVECAPGVRRQVDVARVDAHVAQDALEETVGAAVHVVADDAPGRRAGRGWRWPRWPLRRWRTPGRSGRLRAPRSRARAGPVSGCRSARTPSRLAAGRRRPGRTCWSGRWAAHRTGQLDRARRPPGRTAVPGPQRRIDGSRLVVRRSPREHSRWNRRTPVAGRTSGLERCRRADRRDPAAGQDLRHACSRPRSCRHSRR